MPPILILSHLLKGSTLVPGKSISICQHHRRCHFCILLAPLTDDAIRIICKSHSHAHFRSADEAESRFSEANRMENSLAYPTLKYVVLASDQLLDETHLLVIVVHTRSKNTSVRSVVAP